MSVPYVPMPKAINDRIDYSTDWKSPWKQDLVRKNVTVTRYPVFIRSLVKVPGIYMIRDKETKRMLYIGRALTDLKNTLVRHFYPWAKDRRGKHRRVIVDRTLVEVKCYKIRKEWVSDTEARLILLHRPVENIRLENCIDPTQLDLPLQDEGFVSFGAGYESNVESFQEL